MFFFQGTEKYNIFRGSYDGHSLQLPAVLFPRRLPDAKVSFANLLFDITGRNIKLWSGRWVLDARYDFAFVTPFDISIFRVLTFLVRTSSYILAYLKKKKF